MAVSAVWVTNIPTPYTVPVWRELSQQVDLRVICLGETEPGRHWTTGTGDLDIRYADSPVIHLPKHAVYGPSKTLASHLKQDYDAVVIDGWQAPAYLQAFVHARRRRRRIVMSYWSTARSHSHSRGPVARLRSTIFKAADAVVTPGAAASDCVREFGVDEERIHTGFASVDVEYFQYETRRLRPKPTPSEPHRFLFVGQLIQRKNIQAALDAFQDIRSAGDEFRIIGSGPLHGVLNDYVRENELSEAVSFGGHVEGKALLTEYAQAHTLVLPSTEEVWGLVVNEALAAGLHVVVTNECGAEASVRDMPGVFSALALPDSLADAMSRSRGVWKGPIPDPPILAMTPGRFAETFAAAIHANAPKPSQSSS